MTPGLESQPLRKLISFAENTVNNAEKTSSQRSNYKEALSQPAPGMSHRQKLIWLQKRRVPGLWVQCDSCDKWRFQPNVLERHELPKKWYCRMNRDVSLADCSIPEVPICVRDEEDLIHSEYSAGSVVWARMAGWPWWPAMVDDNPDTEEYYWLDGFSDIPTHYNVVFFDSTEITRAWIAPEHLKPYLAYKSTHKVPKKAKKYAKRILFAITQADNAINLSLTDRLEKYSFIARYQGNICTPRKVSKKELLKYQKILKRKFNVEFPIEVSDDEEITPEKTAKTKSTTLGFSKKSKLAKKQDDSIENVSDVKITVLTESELETMPTETNCGFENILDMDSSKTYVPNTQSLLTPESTENVTTEIETEERNGTCSPNSDNFDF